MVIVKATKSSEAGALPSEDFSPAFRPELRKEVAEKFEQKMRAPVEKRQLS